MSKFKLKKKFIKSLIIITFLIFFIYRLYNRVYAFNYKYNELKDYKNIDVIVKQLKSSDEMKVSYIVKYKQDEFLLNIYNNKNEENFEEKNNIYKYGNILNVTVKMENIEVLKNPGEFNYSLYLNSNNIVTSISTNNIKPAGSRVGNILLKTIFNYKEFLNNKLSQKLNNKHFNLFKSIIYSDDSNLDSKIKLDFKRCASSFILTVSGTHIYFFIYVLNIFIKNKNLKTNILTFILLILFSIFSGGKIPVLRAVISKIIFMVCDTLNIKISRYKRFGLTAIIILSYNIYYIFNVGFILSFSCVLSIMLFSNIINSYINKLCYTTVLKKYIYNQKNILCIILNKIINLLSINFSIIIGTFPLQVNFFSQINIFSVIYSLVLSLISCFEYMLGFLTLFLSFIPIISDILILANYILLDVIIKVASFLSSKSIMINLASFSLLQIIFYYSIIAIKMYKLHILKREVKAKRKALEKVLQIVTVCLFMIILFTYVYASYFENYVIFFNVKQGNMALIKQDGKVILVDMGSTSNNVANNTLENFLKYKGINKIDLILITHFHLDHVNGIYNLDSSIKILNIAYLKPQKSFNVSEEFDKVGSFISKNNISKIELNFLDKLEYKNVEINVICPRDVTIFSSDIANSNSTIYMIKIYDKNYLFMGDATKESEEYYIDYLNKIDNVSLLNDFKNIYVLQVGHHGSDTSTSEEFLNFINVKYAVISSNKKVYSHPSINVLERLNKFNIKYYITEKVGAIKF